jgi:hypothetical protein
MNEDTHDIWAARFVGVQYTKGGKIYKMTTKLAIAH